MKPRSDRRRRRRRDHRARRHPRHVADPAACRCRPQRHGRRRPEAVGHRRRRHRRRDARPRSRTTSASRPTWVDGTAVGGCSFMLHVRHAAAAINEGLCNTVLITHGESGKSRVGADAAAAVAGQPRTASSRRPTASMGPPTMFTIPVLRYMKTYGITEEQLAMVAVVQREWAAKNPRATLQGPDHRRRRAELAHDRLAVPHPDVLPGHRRRRRADPDQRRAGQGLPAQAGLHPRHRRERRDARWSARWRTSPPPGVPRVGQEGLRRGRHQAQATSIT